MIENSNGMDKMVGVESKDFISSSQHGLNHSFDNEESKELSIRYPKLSEYKSNTKTKFFTKKNSKIL